MRFQTEIKLPYEMLTPEQKSEICNGCGGKGSIIKPPHAIFHHASCNHHDYGYFTGNTEEDRLKCDRTLKLKLKRDCARLSWYKKPLYYPWVHLYYIGVRIRGGHYFYYGQKKRWPIITTKQLIQLPITTA